MMAMVKNRVVVGGSFVIVMVKVRDCVMREGKVRKGPKDTKIFWIQDQDQHTKTFWTQKILRIPGKHFWIQRFENLLDPIRTKNFPPKIFKNGGSSWSIST